MTKGKKIALFFMISMLYYGCTNSYDCANKQIFPAFIGYDAADIDSFILRKFKPADNYQTLVDTFLVNYGYSGIYTTFSDTTSVLVSDGKNGIRFGYDWQIYIPATNQTFFISEINSEQKKGKCESGIFAMDKFGCQCTNDLYSAKKDNELISFSNSDTTKNYIFFQR